MCLFWQCAHLKAGDKITTYRFFFWWGGGRGGGGIFIGNYCIQETLQHISGGINYCNEMISAVLSWKPQIFQLQLQFFSLCCVGITYWNAMPFFTRFFCQSIICNNCVSNANTGGSEGFVFLPFFLSGDRGDGLPACSLVRARAQEVIFKKLIISLMTHSTTTRDRTLQFRGAVSTGFFWSFSSDLFEFSPGLRCNLVRKPPQNVEKNCPISWRILWCFRI